MKSTRKSDCPLWRLSENDFEALDAKYKNYNFKSLAFKDAKEVALLAFNKSIRGKDYTPDKQFEIFSLYMHSYAA